MVDRTTYQQLSIARRIADQAGRQLNLAGRIN